MVKTMLPMQGCGWIPGRGTEIPHVRPPTFLAWDRAKLISKKKKERKKRKEKKRKTKLTAPSPQRTLPGAYFAPSLSVKMKTRGISEKTPVTQEKLAFASPGWPGWRESPQDCFLLPARAASTPASAGRPNRSSASCPCQAAASNPAPPAPSTRPPLPAPLRSGNFPSILKIELPAWGKGPGQIKGMLKTRGSHQRSGASTPRLLPPSERSAGLPSPR